MTKTRNSPWEKTEQIQEPKDAVPGTGHGLESCYGTTIINQGCGVRSRLFVRLCWHRCTSASQNGRCLKESKTLCGRSSSSISPNRPTPSFITACSLRECLKIAMGDDCSCGLQEWYGSPPGVIATARHYNRASSQQSVRKQSDQLIHRSERTHTQQQLLRWVQVARCVLMTSTSSP
jgi:hypothetical protein